MKSKIKKMEAALRGLLDAPDLNLDELEPATRAAIDKAWAAMPNYDGPKRRSKDLHTPAPWEVSGFKILGPKRAHRTKPGVTPPVPSQVVAEVETCDRGSYYYYPKPIAEANKRLIAAAPELLKACHAPAVDAAHDKLSDLLEDTDAANDDIRDAAVHLCVMLGCHYDNRTQAIAKAKGTK